MKNILIVLFLSFAINSNAQITLENTYSPNAVAVDYLRLIKLSHSGYKYAVYDTSSIRLFNLNHTLFRNINIPPRSVGLLNEQQLHVYYISEELFNTDTSNIEYHVYFVDINHVGHTRVYDDSGNTLFSKDSTNMSTVTSTASYEDFISFTPSGCKMIIYSGDSLTASVYSLPGTLPCHDCANGVTISSIENNPESFYDSHLSGFPNPSVGQSTIEYELPPGISSASLVFFNEYGNEVKRFTVTNAFHNILITTSDLAAGTYYYQMQTLNGIAGTKKMIVLK